MTTRIRYLGVAAFEVITAAGTRILIDPYLDANPASPFKSSDLDRVDLILVTHAAFDHLGETADIVTQFGCPVVCGADVRFLLLDAGLPAGLLIPVCWGMKVEIGEAQVQVVASHHPSLGAKSDGSMVGALAVGFILILADGLRLYHAGDSALFGDMRLIGELYRPNVGIFPVTVPDLPGVHVPGAHILAGEMTPAEAAMAAQWLSVDYAVPCHFVDPQCAEVEQFQCILANVTRGGANAPRPITMLPGQPFVYDGTLHPEFDS